MSISIIVYSLALCDEVTSQWAHIGPQIDFSTTCVMGQLLPLGSSLQLLYVGSSYCRVVGANIYQAWS